MPKVNTKNAFEKIVTRNTFNSGQINFDLKQLFLEFNYNSNYGNITAKQQSNNSVDHF